jgi:hypothetical protein
MAWSDLWARIIFMWDILLVPHCRAMRCHASRSQVYKPALKRSREIRDAADRPALCRGGVLFGLLPSWRVSCDRRLVGVPFFPPISTPWQ